VAKKKIRDDINIKAVILTFLEICNDFNAPTSMVWIERAIIDLMTTTWVVPCYNEAERWSTEYWTKLLDTTDFHWIFVDDGSTDSTFQKISDIQSKKVSVLRLPQNVGKSEALRIGLVSASESNSDYVGFMDADGAFLENDLKTIEQYAKQLVFHKNVNMVWGSRVALAGHDIQRTRTRHYLGRIVNTFVMWGIDVSIYDTQCGLKLFCNDEYFQKSLNFQTKTRWFFDLEIYSQFSRVNLLKPIVLEYPLQSWREIPGSKISISKFPSIFREIIYIRNLMKTVK
jgi:glycosyltransferase involved in cell wall biosynthesis